MGIFKEINEEAIFQLENEDLPTTLENIHKRSEEIKADFAKWADGDFKEFVKYCEENTVRCCAECGSPEVGERQVGEDESLTICPDCNQIEGDTYELNPYQAERIFG